MRRGPKPKAAKLKIANGSAAKDPQRVNRREPQQDSARPQMPRGLDTVARREWQALSAYLSHLGILSKTYERAMALYCETYSMYRQALTEVDERGLVITTANGRNVRNPAAAEVHRCRDACLKLLSEFGLTPTAKTRIVTEKPLSDSARFFGE